jgi:hypothetical protein
MIEDLRVFLVKDFKIRGGICWSPNLLKNILMVVVYGSYHSFVEKFKLLFAQPSFTLRIRAQCRKDEHVESCSIPQGSNLLPITALIAS